MFFFKRKKIVVDCFTDNVTAYEFHPIAKSTNFIPQWFKDIPAYNAIPSQERGAMLVDKSTIKKCTGVVSLFKQGYILPSWSDIQLSTANNGCEWFFGQPGRNPPAEHHQEFQYGNTFSKQFHIKVMSPWYLKQNRYCDILMQPVIWNDPTHWADYTVLPGVIDFVHQHSTHINMFLERGRHKIFIHAGTPLYQMIPLTEDEVEFKPQLVDEKEIHKLYSRKYGTINNVYRNIKRVFKNKQSKCPFA